MMCHCQLFSLPEPYSIGRLRCPSSVVHTLQTSSQKPLSQSKPNFIWSLIGMGEQKFVHMIQVVGPFVHMIHVVWPRWPPCPLYGKNPLKIFFPGTKGPMTLELGMQHWGLGPNKICSNDDLGLTMTFFRARSNLLLYVLYAGFPQAFENLENGLKKFPCMEKSWNLKVNEKSWNFGMRLLSGGQYHSNFSRSLCSLNNFKKIRFSFFNRAIRNHLFFIIKLKISFLFNYLCNISIFAFYIALYD